MRNIRDDVVDVWMRLTTFCNESIEYISAIDAFERAKGEVGREEVPELSLIAVCRRALERQYIASIQLIFDKAHFKQRDNCSVMLLRELCLTDEMKILFKDGEEDEIIQALNQCQKQYEKCIPLEIRNRMMAHHDLEKIRSLESTYVYFEDIKNLIIQLSEVLNKVASRLMGIDVTYESIESRVDRFISDAIKWMEIDGKRKNSRRLVRVKCLCQTIRV